MTGKLWSQLCGALEPTPVAYIDTTADETPEKTTPCDGPEHRCPYINSDDEVTPMYFCRDHCGLGVG